MGTPGPGSAGAEGTYSWGKAGKAVGAVLSGMTGEESLRGISAGILSLLAVAYCKAGAGGKQQNQ